MDSENKSEVARLLQQVALEYEAAQRGLTGFSESARHAFITTRTENSSRLRCELVECVGDQEAMHFLKEQDEQIVEQKVAGAH